MQEIRDKIAVIYNDENTTRIANNILGNKVFYTCVKNETDNKYYCMRDVWFNSSRYDTKDISICKYIPERFVGTTIKYKHGFEYIKE
jgi:hypothetical protein